VDDVEMLSEARRRLPAARTALAVAIGDMPCSGTSQGGSGTSDRTGRIALGVIEGVDTAWTDTRELDRLERIIIAKCNAGQSWTYLLPRVLDIVDRWAPTPRRRTALHNNLRSASDDLLNKSDDHGNCTSCKRVPGAWGEPHRQGMCKTCARYIDRITALYVVAIDMPPRALIEISEARGKVTDHDIHTTMHGHTRRDA
jgi:hypothetical protein